MKFDDLHMCRITKTNIIKAHLQKTKKNIITYNVHVNMHSLINIQLDCDQLRLQRNHCLSFLIKSCFNNVFYLDTTSH